MAVKRPGPVLRGGLLLAGTFALAGLAAGAVAWTSFPPFPPHFSPHFSPRGGTVLSDAGGWLPGWLVSAVGSRGFLLAALAAVASAGGLVLITGLLWQAGRPGRAGRAGRYVRRTDSGSAVVEFALALPVAMVLSLIMAQSSLLMAGNLCVQYAAYCAARSAVVQVPLDLSQREPANVLDASDDGKLSRIRTAALWAVMPVSANVPGADVDPSGGDLAAGLRRIFTDYGASVPAWLRDGNDPGGYLGRKLAYADDYTELTILERTSPPGGPADYAELQYPYTYRPHDEIRVAVRYTFFLAVPYAARIFAALDNGRELGAGAYGLDLSAACSMPNEGAGDYIKVEAFE